LEEITVISATVFCSSRSRSPKKIERGPEADFATGISAAKTPQNYLLMI
jgi:hypothetical protein